MVDESRLGKRRLLLDGAWGLEELSGFGRQYVQAYSFLHGLRIGDVEDEWNERVEYAFRAFPWRGGWSAVDFYETLRVSVPKRHRPKIVAITYASPGYIDLGVVITVAAALSGLVRHICKTIDRVNGTYNGIQSGIRERKMGRISLKRAEMELSTEELKYADGAFDKLADAMGLGQDEQQAIRFLAPNHMIALKILMSFYRRLRTLAKLQNTGKIEF